MWSFAPRCAACCKMICSLAAHAAMRSAPAPNSLFPFRRLPPLHCTTSLRQTLSTSPRAPPKLHRPRTAALVHSLAEPPTPHCHPLSPHAAIIPRAKIHPPLAPPHPKVQTSPCPQKPERRCAACRYPKYRSSAPVQSCNPALPHSSVSCAFIQPLHVCRAWCTRSFPCPLTFVLACGPVPVHDPAQPPSTPRSARGPAIPPDPALPPRYHIVQFSAALPSHPTPPKHIPSKSNPAPRQVTRPHPTFPNPTKKFLQSAKKKLKTTRTVIVCYIKDAHMLFICCT